MESLLAQMDQHDFSSDVELAPKKRVDSEMDTTISNSDAQGLANKRIHKQFKSGFILQSQVDKTNPGQQAQTSQWSSKDMQVTRLVE